MRRYGRVTIGMVLAGVAAQSMATPADHKQTAECNKPALKASCIKASLLNLASSSKSHSCSDSDTAKH